MSEKRKIVISIHEARETLEKLDPEKMDQIQKKTLDYLKKFSKIDAEKAKYYKKALVSECGLTEEEAVEVINIMPTTIEELRVFSAGWKKLIPSETLKKILEILSK